MSEIVNLNRARKSRARAEVTRQAAENRIVHGRTKAERTFASKEAAKTSADLEGHKREP